LSVNGKFKDITRSDLLTVAERFHVANPIKRIDSILAVIDNWTDYARQAGVSSQRAEDLQQAFKATTSLLA
jgi:serine/threonine-protein kinase HipA